MFLREKGFLQKVANAGHGLTQISEDNFAPAHRRKKYPHSRRRGRQSSGDFYTKPQKVSDFDLVVDRDVPIAIY